jgi:catechol 2,3-dioxygenase-like lactoylglutathione lyase family enzyme
VLHHGRVATRIPAQDLNRARAFYADKLGRWEVDRPGLKTVDAIAEVEGNYPSKGGKGERAAWFRDSEGNMLGIGQPID